MQGLLWKLSESRKLSGKFPGEYIQMESDDAWARDVGPTFVKMRMALSEESTGVLMPGAARWTDCTQTGQRMTE